MAVALPSSLSRFQKGAILFAIVMLLFTVARGILLLNYPELFDSLDSGAIAGAFVNGLRFDGAVVARLFAIPLLLMWLPLRVFDKRIWFDSLAWLLYLLTLGLLLLLAGDIIYFDHVQRHVSYELLLLQNDAGFLVDYGLRAYPLAVLGFAIFAVALAWVWLKLLRIPLATPRYAPLKYIGLFFLLAAIGRGGVTGKVVEVIDAYSNGDAAYGHLSLNGAFTTVVFALNMEKVDHKFFPQEKALSAYRGGDKLLDEKYPMLKRYDSEATGYNIVFILMESWNFRHVDSMSGESFGATPYFDALVRDGLSFPNFYSAGQRSIEGVQATLTGIPVLKGMPRIDTGIGVSNISRLGNIAKQDGYSTLFIQTSDRDSYKLQGVARATGFDHFYGREDVPLLLDYPEPDAAVFGWDYDTLQFMKNKLDELESPFLAYAFTGTTHGPFGQFPEQFMRFEPHEPRGEMGYLNALSYADWSIGRFIEEARKSPWFDKTIFIFTADHINQFQRDKRFTERFHIPFLIYAPGIIEPGRSPVIGSQLDVMPTIIDLLGLNGEFAALGESLFRKEDGGEAFVTMGGQQIGLINRHGFIRHDLKHRIESGGVEDGALDALETRLLSMDQLSYQLLKANRWAR